MLIDGFTLFGSWPGLPYDHQVEELVSGLERHRIDRACALSSKGIFFDAAAGNASTWMTCQEFPSLIPIGVADPRIDGQAQVDFCKETGFRLISLFPAGQNWSLASIAARAVLKQIDDVQLPVLIEAGEDGAASGILAATGDLTMPLLLLDVSLRTITEALAVLRARPQTFLATRLLCGGDTIEYLVDEVGAQSLVFTSRFPISCFSSAFLTAKFANISEADQQAIMGGNMARLVGLE